MVNFNELDPETRAQALVGRFLQSWAAMESLLRAAIAKALDLQQMQAAIVCANIQLRDKINILKTALSISHIYPKEEATRFAKTLDDIANYAPTRNMMAHDGFLPSEDGKGVEFFVTRAKGKLDFPKVVWGVEEFDEAESRLAFFGTVLVQLKERVQDSVLLRALMLAPSRTPVPESSPKTIPGLFGLGLLNLQLPPSPTDQQLDMTPATQQTHDETPPETRE